MATLLELANIFGTTDFTELLNKITVAVAIKADSIINEASPSASRLAWAQLAIEDPRQEAKKFIWGVIAANESVTVAQIIGASDNAIQTNINDYVDKLYA